MRLIAHRGFAGIAPENTLRAVRQACTVADLVEVDVRRCASGELVVIHDQTVDRVTDATGRVSDLTLAELHDLDVLDTDEPIPTLAAVFDIVPGDVGLNVHLMESGLAADVLELAGDTVSDVLFSAFDPDHLDEARAVDPYVPRALLFETDPQRHLDEAMALDCIAVHPHYELCLPPFVQRAHVRGFSVNAWTVRDAATASRLADADVDGVIADFPDVLEAT